MEQIKTPLSLPEEAVTELLESIFTYASEGMVLIGPDYTVKHFNDRFVRQVLRTPKDLLYGVTIDQLMPGFGPGLTALCARVKERKEPFITDTLKIIPVFGQGQTFVGWLFLLAEGYSGMSVFSPEENGSDHGRMNQELSSSLRKVRIEQLLTEMMLSNLPVGIAVYDSVSLRLKWANPVFRGLVGETNGILGGTLRETIPGAEQNGLIYACEYVAMTGEPFCAPELRIDGFQRGVCYWRLTIVRLDLAEPEVPVLLFIVVDLTDQHDDEKQKEKLANSLESSLAQLETVEQTAQERRITTITRKARTEAERQDMQRQVLLDNIREGVLVLDPDGRLLLANKVALEITGVKGWPETIEELLSPAALFRKDGSRLAPHEQLTTRLLKGDYFTDEEYRLKRADGNERYLLISGNGVKDRQGQIFMNLVTIRDVTELRNLEQIREEYLHMVSHDLRSPLAVILSHAQLLGLLAKEETKIAHSAQVIAVSALRMNNMIADLVDSTRIESGQLVLKTVCFDLERFIRDLLLRVQGVMDVDRIRIVKRGPLLPVIADPNRLERIFVNFLSNALKYSPPETMVEIEYWVSGTYMVIAIRDEGEGISPVDLARIFDRFYRVRAGGEEGIGLGLYIVKKLVEAHGGKVWAESTPEQGSTFYFTLPVASRQEAEEEQPPRPERGNLG